MIIEGYRNEFRGCDVLSIEGGRTVGGRTIGGRTVEGQIEDLAGVQ
jgi:hypothetical protein